MRRGDALARMARLQPLLAQFGYATCGLYGRTEPVLVLRVADAAAASDALVAELDRILELDDDSCAMTYLDAKRGVSKRVLVQDGVVVGARLNGETAARDWLKDLMAQGAAADAVRAWTLAPLSSPPTGSKNRGRIVCNCFDVSEQEIQAELAQGADLAALQSKLKCGTECGSCLPELKRLCGAKEEAT
jgi:assimilatory nitrate reductase catalytic subunit